MNSEAWLVCHTRAQCEKKFARLLDTENFEHYLPLLESVRTYGRRSRTYTKPLFPGYVFAKVPHDRRPRIYQQQLLARTINIPDERQFLNQLEDVKALLKMGLEVTVKPLLAKGRRVRISNGPLRGVEGYVDNADNAEGIVVAVDILQQGLLVKMAFGDLQMVA